MGANAVINVRYERGISATSWKALTAHGTAVVIESSSDIVWTKTGFEYLLGYTLGSPSYGIWHRDQLGMPKHRFPYSEHGKAEALSMFGTLEPNAEDVPPPLPPRP